MSNFKLITMKKLFFILTLITFQSLFQSCTADEIPTNYNTQLSDSGGQNGQLPNTPPKP
ncbi:MAG: hypothetical protein ACI9XR_001561 [Flavobacterium sp.]|jgi:hypothetical protein